MIIFYVLITYGSQSSGSLRDHPQASAQLENYGRIATQFPDASVRVVVDYARKIRSLDDLPKLQAILMKFRKMDSGQICIDDLARVFRYTPFAYRENLLSELQEFAAHLFSLNHSSRLSGLSKEQQFVMLQHSEKASLWRGDAGPRDTTKARAASAVSRSRASQALSQKIKKVRSGLEEKHGAVTLQAVADEANMIGLRTATGKHWTRQTIKKALDRYCE